MATRETFEPISFKVIIESGEGASNKRSSCEATVKLKIGQDFPHTVAEGNGPVNALDNALRKALYCYGLDHIKLVAYNVHVADDATDTAASVWVRVTFSDGKGIWTVEKESTDVIKASFDALVEGLQMAIQGFASDIYDG